MKTIVIESQKGGSGKTMLAAHLPVEAERNGEAAWVIDTDRQATLSLWHERRKNDTPQRLDAPLQRMPAALAKVAAQGAAYCFIDTAPTISEQNTSLLRLADLILIPVRPSPSDLWAVAETVAQVKEAGKPLPVCRHPGETAGDHHRPGRRRSFAARQGGAGVHF